MPVHRCISKCNKPVQLVVQVQYHVNVIYTTSWRVPGLKNLNLIEAKVEMIITCKVVFTDADVFGKP